MTTATALKHAGQQLATHAADSRTIARIDAIIADLNASGEPWSSNTVRERITVTSRGLVGARVDAARKRGEMCAVGWERSTLPSTRCKPVTVWVGA